MKKALLVIDMQEICIGENHADYFKYDDSLLISVNQVIDNSQDKIIVYIRNVMKNNLINKFAPFHAYEGSREIELAEGLHIVSENVFDKFVGDAFSNKKLDEFLKSNEVDEIEVIGVDGGACVAMTALGALKNGYSVIVNTKAIGTMFEKKKTSYFEKLKKSGAKFI